jgi:hypothetical protein
MEVNGEEFSVQFWPGDSQSGMYVWKLFQLERMRSS